MDVPTPLLQPPIPVPGTPAPAAPKAAEPTPPDPKAATPAPAAPAAPTPPAATTPPVAETPKPAPEPGTPAVTPPGDAAGSPAAPTGPPQAELVNVKDTLTQIVSSPRFIPTPEPEKKGGFTDDRVKGIFKTYSEIPSEQEAEAFGLVLKSSVDIAREELAADQQRERVQQQNGAKARELVTAVYQQISEVVRTQAPDVDLKDFWEYAAPKAERETPVHLTNPIDRWEWQTKRAVAIYREKFGTRPAPTPDPASNPTAIQRPATASIPAGSLLPRGGTPGRPRTMADQMGAIQDRILPGAGKR